VRGRYVILAVLGRADYTATGHARAALTVGVDTDDSRGFGDSDRWSGGAEAARTVDVLG
jgi:hypothetical protein